jgi:hypothetical protein
LGGERSQHPETRKEEKRDQFECMGKEALHKQVDVAPRFFMKSRSLWRETRKRLAEREGIRDFLPPIT